MIDLDYVRKFPDKCDQEVTRRGESQPCELPAIAAGVWDHQAYAVCLTHAKRAGVRGLVPLADLIGQVSQHDTSVSSASALTPEPAREPVAWGLYDRTGTLVSVVTAFPAGGLGVLRVVPLVPMDPA